MSTAIDLSLVQEALDKTIDTKAVISASSHLIDERILDSLDSAVFLLQIEKLTAVKITDRQVEENDLYSVPKLLDFLKAQA